MIIRALESACPAALVNRHVNVTVASSAVVSATLSRDRHSAISMWYFSVSVISVPDTSHVGRGAGTPRNSAWNWPPSPSRTCKHAADRRRTTLLHGRILNHFFFKFFYLIFLKLNDSNSYSAIRSKLQRRWARVNDLFNGGGPKSNPYLSNFWRPSSVLTQKRVFGPRTAKS